MININNVVIVRFSMKLSDDWQSKAYGESGSRESWFRYRCNLFSLTLLNSLRSQTIKPHYCVVLMDPDDRFLYDSFFPKDKLIMPIFTKRFDNLHEQDPLVNIPHLAVSRVDSDDILSNNYFEEVNKSIIDSIADNIPFKFVVACSGYRSNLREFQNIYYNCSPFLTVYEGKKLSTNIYLISHEDVLNLPHIQNHTARWIQILHDTNISNAFIDSELGINEFQNAVLLNPKLRVSKKEVVGSDTFNNFTLDPNISKMLYK